MNRPAVHVTLIPALIAWLISASMPAGAIVPADRVAASAYCDGTALPSIFGVVGAPDAVETVPGADIPGADIPGANIPRANIPEAKSPATGLRYALRAISVPPEPISADSGHNSRKTDLGASGTSGQPSIRVLNWNIRKARHRRFPAELEDLAEGVDLVLLQEANISAPPVAALDAFFLTAQGASGATGPAARGAAIFARGHGPGLPFQNQSHNRSHNKSHHTTQNRESAYKEGRNSLSEQKKPGRGKRTGVLTLGRALPLAHCRFAHREPWLRTLKATSVALFRMDAFRDKGHAGGKPAGSAVELLVVNLHGVNFSVRSGALAEQLNAAAGMIRGHLRAQRGPVIFAGDFNTWNPARTALLKGLAEDLGLSEVHFDNDRRSNFMGRPVDHFLVRGLRVLEARTPVVRGSDHNPLLVTLELTPPAPPTKP